MTTSDPYSLARRVIGWQRAHGRNGLPWQGTRDPYKVWLSEIMLQQTQVSTVRAYFARFMERFKDVRALAAAREDDVLCLWSGLGYYSRARNVHRCAQQIVNEWNGQFPHSAAQLVTLPGIGKSTAAAIAAFCFGERTAILDANVKRVLARVMGFGGDLAQATHEKELWALATDMLPQKNLQRAMPIYTQGMMDLGAMVCTPRKPLCTQCPLGALCEAYRHGTQSHYPVKTRKLQRKTQTWQLLFAQDVQGRLWLERRPSKGIWAGLYCPPVAVNSDIWPSINQPLRAATPARHLPCIAHTLTHMDIFLEPVVITLPKAEKLGENGNWFDAQGLSHLGLPAPIRKILQEMCSHPAPLLRAVE